MSKEFQGRYSNEASAGFPIVWTHISRNNIYSLAQVPASEKGIALQFELEQEKVRMQLTPTQDSYTWRVSGIANPNTLKYFFENTKDSLKVYKHALEKEELAEITKRGCLTMLEGNHTTPQYKIDTHFPTSNVYEFLNNLWQPRNREGEISSHIHHVRLGEGNSQLRVLPLKELNYGGNPERARTTFKLKRIPKKSSR